MFTFNFQLLLDLTEVNSLMRFLVTERILFSKMGIGVVFISELIFLFKEIDEDKFNIL